MLISPANPGRFSFFLCFSSRGILPAERQDERKNGPCQKSMSCPLHNDNPGVHAVFLSPGYSMEGLSSVGGAQYPFRYGAIEYSHFAASLSG